MSAPLLGRVVGDTIELDAPLPALDGKRVRITVEVVEPDEHPAALAWRDAAPDDAPITPEERASIEDTRRDARWSTTAEVRARLASRERPGG